MSERKDESDGEEPVRAGHSEKEMRERLVKQVFGGDEAALERFCDVLREGVPAGTAAVLRGSAVTGFRHSDGQPFDADGPGTSDLDLTLVGSEILKLYILDGFYIPGVHTKPLGEMHGDIAPDLLPLRRRLVEMVGRPVNIQGTRDWMMFVREHLMRQPYLTLIGKVETSAS
jgi:hypothetical protein